MHWHLNVIMWSYKAESESSVNCNQKHGICFMYWIILPTCIYVPNFTLQMHIYDWRMPQGFIITIMSKCIKQSATCAQQIYFLRLWAPLHSLRRMFFHHSFIPILNKLTAALVTTWAYFKCPLFCHFWKKSIILHM